MGKVFLYGVGGGGNKAKPEQEKNVVISENGTTEVVPDEEKVLSKVNIEVNVPPPEGFLKPEGRLEILEDGIYDVEQYKEVQVNTTDTDIGEEYNGEISIQGQNEPEPLPGKWTFSEEIQITEFSEYDLVWTGRFINEENVYKGITKTLNSETGVTSLKYVAEDDSVIEVYNDSIVEEAVRGWLESGFRVVEILDDAFDENFETFVRANARKETAELEQHTNIISFNGVTIQNTGPAQTTVIDLGGKKMQSDIAITFGRSGLFTYQGALAPVSAQQTVVLPCEGQRLTDNIIIDTSITGYSVESHDEGLSLVMEEYEIVEEENGTTIVLG